MIYRVLPRDLDTFTYEEWLLFKAGVDSHRARVAQAERESNA